MEQRLIAGLPRDPFTNARDTWRVVYAPGAHGQAGGIIGVRSGSDAVGSDSQPYAVW